MRPTAVTIALDAPEQHRSLLLALVLSLALHASLLPIISIKKPRPSYNPIVVSLLKPPPQAEQKRQIVSPSQAPEIPPPESVKRLSERDSSTPVEKIRRGVPSPAPAKAAPTPAKKKSPRQLRLKDSQLLAKLGETLPEKRKSNDRLPTKNSNAAASAIKDYRPFAHRQFSNAFDAELGDPDFLPKIPDGDVTLLNAKAYRYAVFVRRVALQVFGALRRHSWQTLPYQSARSVRAFSRVEARLSKSGKLLSVSLIDSSGNKTFDKVLTAAASDGAWDKNPPAGAESPDGTIRFVFQSRIWSRRGPEGVGEQRWILLGTGLL